MSVLFKGPGWAPGKQWVGNLEDIPHPTPEFVKYDPTLPLWAEIYIKIHFVIFLNAYLQFALNLALLSNTTIFAAGWFLTFSTITFGFILDKSQYAAPLEFLRCILYFLVDGMVYSEVHSYTFASISINMNRVIFFASTILWIFIAIFSTSGRIYKKIT